MASEAKGMIFKSNFHIVLDTKAELKLLQNYEIVSIEKSQVSLYRIVIALEHRQACKNVIGVSKGQKLYSQGTIS